MNVLTGINSITPTIEISTLIKERLISEGNKTVGKYLTENNAGDKILISVNADLRDPKKMLLKLKYQVDPDSPLIELEIRIISIKTSSRNKVGTLHFCCPFSNYRFSRTLYLSYLTHLFVSRESHPQIADNRKPEVGYLPITNMALLEIFKIDKNKYLEEKNRKLNEAIAEEGIKLN